MPPFELHQKFAARPHITVGEMLTLAAEIDPQHALAWDSEREQRTSQDFLAMKTTSIAGGPTQIQKNIISERVLGLPRDVDPERNVSFNKRNRA